MIKETTADQSGRFSVLLNGPLNPSDSVEATQTPAASAGNDASLVGSVLNLTNGPAEAASSTAKASAPSVPSGDGSWNSTHVMGLVGGDVASTTTSGPQWQYFAEFNLRAPLTKPNTKFGAHWEAWLTPRVASIPSSKTPQVSSLTSLSSASAGLGQQTLANVVQSLDLRGGVEYDLRNSTHSHMFSGVTTRVAMVPGIIAGGGFVSPLTSYSGAQEFDLNSQSGGSSGSSGVNVANLASEFTNSAQLRQAYPQLYSAICTASPNNGPPAKCATTESQYQQVALTLPDRSRFQRNYFAGIRLHFFYFDSKDSQGNAGPCSQDQTKCPPLKIYPGIVEMAFGQDESVTAGKLRGVVMTLTGNFPFPGLPFLRLFGSAHLGLQSNRTLPNLELPATQSFIPLNNPAVLIQPIQPVDQDYFRIGVGVDIGYAIKSLFGKGVSAGRKLAGS